MSYPILGAEAFYSSGLIIIRWLFNITYSIIFFSALKLRIDAVISRYLPCPAGAVLHPIEKIVKFKISMSNCQGFLLVAHVSSVVIFCGGLRLITDSSILSAAVSIISAGLLVTLAFIGAKIKIETLKQFLGSSSI